ncbi:hypothetical protein G3545_28400 [Starkeya sp. ORNL1]|uniref:hypothetical protein n=1 Tax=Starkeya sp. ORNL1 TaxID=2709380 RepID=UPI00146416C5|nr:hypothetical protein [Starkeya sp. ORNL1]QJP17219.1 hypothetical protein G3545_28400 [Starkeya sp. ORNL1]
MHTPVRHPAATTRRPEDTDKAGDIDLGIVCVVSSVGLWLTCLVTVAVNASVLGLILVLLAGAGIAGNAWRLVTSKR